jgi:hypothetical protein
VFSNAFGVNTMKKKLHPKKLQRGDILVCRPDTFDAIGKRIVKQSKSSYTHAAIYLGGGEVAEARPGHGVCLSRLGELSARYAHVAVLRHPDAFTHDRPARLRDFIQKLISRRAGYSYYGAGRLHAERGKRDEEMLDRIRSYFVRGQPLKWKSRNYFCSQLVVACLIDSGFLAESAVAVYPPHSFYPGDFLLDPTFGLRVGFLARAATYQLPADDPFLCCRLGGDFR